ncbi:MULTISPECIES: urease accessory protein UreF [unclassified Peribacillus]|uniref:urease accessory protein UreF n=1 Tax=unclassified Peribacillus TaxID=2675266 RepID=UPI001913A67C|nr:MULTISPECIES: urease accessory protein UreF [unclassified Peribacillus]MBK5461204.1 urease accessory protein UreF [Peribacillus sp. TH27]MBK5499346.1 urease accessory protein UreF [Peribacillus sp. TH14]
MNNNILSLFQLCDSNLPTGAFSHSFGLESYIQEDQVKDQKTFFQWLKVYLHEQLIYSDGLASRLVYEALMDEDIQEIWNLDRLLTVQNLPRETREGTQMIGDRMLKLTESLYGMPILSQYRAEIKRKSSFGHPAIVFSMVAHGLGVTKPDTILYYLYSAISSQVQNAVRAIPLGQTAGQTITHNFIPELTQAVERILQLTKDDFGIVSPGIELSQMKHERVNIRIFMS